MSGTTFVPTEETKARGALIYKARMAAKWTQQDLAIQIGVSRVAISNYEKGKVREIAFPIASRLSELLDIPIVMLLTDDQKAARALLRGPHESSRVQPGILEDPLVAGLSEVLTRKLSNRGLQLALLFDELPDGHPAKEKAWKAITDVYRTKNSIPTTLTDMLERAVPDEK